ncbi:MAG: SpoVR family protein [Chloroflexi bacterium]|nr:SpoVR family protein [Chloroflexota bacterium]MCI0580299.1 SpoVR family protein [Chloroflexota bacterium]
MQETIEGYAREFGLDFFPVQFEMVDYQMMNQLAAYDGFPTRYPHWRFGMEYERMSKSYAYGLHRIYEMVINTNPCYAYLLASNNLVDHKLVMAHVYGHCDFFKNNLWFAHTNRRMLDEVANHSTRIRRYVSKYGLEEVENFLDACLSLENLIDIHAPGVRRRPQPEDHEGEEERPVVHRIKAKDYMDSYINPPDFLAAQQRKLEEARARRKHLPEEPERDVLLFLLEYAPLENWQHDVLDIVREEAYYFSPQRQTKIMNEGWASYTHSHIMTRRALDPNELIDYADHHSGTMAVHSGRLNPYKLGLELLRDVEDRWNRGAFGPEYEACHDMETRRNWDRKLGLGREKLFEVRRVYNDVGFIDEFLTADFAREHKLFTFAYNEATENYEIASREFEEIKRRLLFQLTNFGQPIIEVVDSNYDNRGELYLVHRHEGIDLDIPYAEETLSGLFTLWQRPVHVETVLEKRGRVLFSHGPDGGEQRRL